MSEFKNVTVVKAANIYFDGKVTSRLVKFDDGSRKTLGIMQPGDYEFGTEQKELRDNIACSSGLQSPVNPSLIHRVRYTLRYSTLVSLEFG